MSIETQLIIYALSIIPMVYVGIRLHRDTDDNLYLVYFGTVAITPVFNTVASICLGLALVYIYCRYGSKG